MKKYIAIISLTVLTVLFSACTSTTISPTINNTLTKIDRITIKSIADINSIALEWGKVEDPNVTGYNIYRADVSTSTNVSLKLVKTIDNRYTTHYVDEKLQPNTRYAYQFSTKNSQGQESETTIAYYTQTLPRLEAVSYIQAISNLPNRIKIIWRPHENNTIQYYRVQKFNTNTNTWENIAKVDGRLQVEYIDKNLGNNVSYQYRVIAYNFKDVASQVSSTVVGTTKPLPQSPTNISATANGVRQITIAWTASPTQDVVKYAIYRSPYKSFGYRQKATVGADQTSVINKVEEDGKKYFYKVYAIDKDGLVSNENVTPTEGQSLGKPTAPVITYAQIVGNKVVLNWSATDNRATSYIVYKKTSTGLFNSKITKYTNVLDTKFEDPNILNGTDYEYSVQSVDSNGIPSQKSEEVTLSLPEQK